jgi:hypothetical protein
VNQINSHLKAFSPLIKMPRNHQLFLGGKEFKWYPLIIYIYIYICYNTRKLADEGGDNIDINNMNKRERI